jgi:BolA family transcriptional regulator, general stress-responsive regulator
VELTNQIKNKLMTECHPEHMELINESHMHAGPATESHFKLIMVSTQFSELKSVKRHQLVYRILKEELAGPVHALALHLSTPEEWKAQNVVPDSPLCSGKNI